MPATKTLNESNYSNLKIVTDNGDGTGALNTIGGSAGASSVTTTTTASSVTATTTSGAVLAANASRQSAIIVNAGASDVYLRRGATAVAGQGILIKANGGAYEINSTNLYRGAINCITASGSSALSIEEGV